METSNKNTTPAAQPASPTKAPRRRGPNKPKPGTIEVRTEASMNQAEIVKLLTAHVTAMLGAEAAADMELQVNDGGGWLAPHERVPHGAVIRFATKGHR